MIPNTAPVLVVEIHQHLIKELSQPTGWQHIEGCLMVAESILPEISLHILSGKLPLTCIPNEFSEFVHEITTVALSLTSSTQFEVQQMTRVHTII